MDLDDLHSILLAALSRSFGFIPIGLKFSFQVDHHLLVALNFLCTKLVNMFGKHGRLMPDLVLLVLNLLNNGQLLGNEALEGDADANRKLEIINRE